MSASALSDVVENSLLDLLLRATAYAAPSTLHFSLHTTDPGESGVAGEVSEGGYARAALTNSAVNFLPDTTLASISNVPTITFPAATASWGTITHWACYDSALAGTNVMIAHGELSTPRLVSIGDTPKIPSRALVLSMSNSAAGGLTVYSQKKLLSHLFGKTAFTPPATIYSGFGTALAGETLTEWNRDFYTRKAMVFAAASNGLSANSAEVVFTNEYGGTTDVLLSHFGLWDDVNSGNLIAVGPVAIVRTVKQYDTVKVAAGGITITLA